METRFYWIVALSIGLIVIALQAIALAGHVGLLWGVHAITFFGGAAPVVAWLVILAAAWITRPGTTLDPGRPLVRLTQRPVHSAVVVAAFCALCFWVLRLDHLFLGDAVPLTVNLPLGEAWHPRQPLTALFNDLLFKSTAGWFGVAKDAEAAAGDVVAFGSVLAGVTFVVIALQLGADIARMARHNKETGWLIAFVIIAQGYMQLYFGYIENYAYYATALLLFIWLSLRFIDGRVPLIAPTLAAAFAILLHLSGAIVLPALAVLYIWALRQPARRRAALRDLAIGAGAAITIQMVLLATPLRYNLLSTLSGVTTQALTRKGEMAGNYMFSIGHVQDFINEHLLVGPYALLAFVPAGVYVLRTSLRRNTDVVFGLVLGGAYAAVAWLAGDSNLGYARNWDLFAPSGVAFTAIALLIMVRHMKDGPALRRVLLLAWAISIVIAGPWVVLNHSEARSLERFATLPLGLGRVEMVIGNYYIREGDTAQAMQWFQRSVRANEQNAPAWAFIGMLHSQAGRYEAALAPYEKAVRYRPDKLQFRNNYMKTLIELGHDAEAVRQLQWLTEKEPTNVAYHIELCTTLERLGRAEELHAARVQFAVLLDRIVVANPRDTSALLNSAIVLVQLREDERALGRFQQVLNIDQNSGPALYNAGMLLAQMGQDEDARRILGRFVQLYPNHPNAAYARDTMSKLN